MIPTGVRPVFTTPPVSRDRAELPGRRVLVRTPLGTRFLEPVQLATPLRKPVGRYQLSTPVRLLPPRTAAKMGDEVTHTLPCVETSSAAPPSPSFDSEPAQLARRNPTTRSRTMTRRPGSSGSPAYGSRSPARPRSSTPAATRTTASSMMRR